MSLKLGHWIADCSRSMRYKVLHLPGAGQAAEECGDEAAEDWLVSGLTVCVLRSLRFVL